MIQVTRLDGTDVVVNCELVTTIERTPDTMITLVNGQKLLVRDSVEEVVARAIAYHRRLHDAAGMADRVSAVPISATTASPNGTPGGEQSGG